MLASGFSFIEVIVTSTESDELPAPSDTVKLKLKLSPSLSGTTKDYKQKENTTLLGFNTAININMKTNMKKRHENTSRRKLN